MRIVIAEDESIIRLGLKKMLEQMGHMVWAAANGREALQMVRKHQPDLAILDVQMPYTDGLHTAKNIAQIHPIPVLLLTAFSDDALIAQAAELPIHGYLVKPTSPPELKAAIAVACKRFEEMVSLLQANAALQEKLETRKLVDRAKGALMVQKGLSEEDAYRLLQLRAREGRLSLKEVALAVVRNEGGR